MSLDEEIHLRLWRARVGNLDIGQKCTFDGVRITRPARNRYVVYQRDERTEIGGRNMAVFTACQLVLNLVLHQTRPILCNRCHRQPREEGSSWCGDCNRNASRNAMRAKRRSKAAKFAALLGRAL